MLAGILDGSDGPPSSAVGDDAVMEARGRGRGRWGGVGDRMRAMEVRVGCWESDLVK